MEGGFSQVWRKQKENFIINHLLHKGIWQSDLLWRLEIPCADNIWVKYLNIFIFAERKLSVSVILFYLSHRTTDIKCSWTLTTQSQGVKSVILIQSMLGWVAFQMDFDLLETIFNHQHLEEVHTTPHNLGPLIPFLFECLDFLPVETIQCWKIICPSFTSSWKQDAASFLSGKNHDP